MRDFRDAKAMAQTLRDSLIDKTVTISHSESLELVSKMLGVADWNTLSALIQSGPREVSKPPANAGRAPSYPAVPIRDFVPFPSATVPLFIGREKTVRALDQAFERQREVVLAVQKESTVDDPGLDDVHEIGVLAGVLDLIPMDNGTMKVITQSYRRIAIRKWFGETGASVAEIADLAEGPIPEAIELVRRTIDHFRTYAQMHEIDVASFWPLLVQVRDPGRIADMISPRLRAPLSEKKGLLAMLDPVARLEKVHALIVADLPPTAASVAR
jgi:ATP-dependent Lon protease